MSGWLLDTHVLLWWFDEPSRLSESARGVLGRSPDRSVFVSSASIWEAAIKRALGKLRMPDDLLEQMVAERIDVLDITAAHALAAASLPALHADPFDRMLVAQSRLEGLVLVTRDARLARYGGAVLEA